MTTCNEEFLTQLRTEIILFKKLSMQFEKKYQLNNFSKFEIKLR